MGKNKHLSSNYSKLGVHAVNFMKLIDCLSLAHNVYNVFSDFCKLSALTFSNIADKSNFEEREKDYLDTINTYRALSQNEWVGEVSLPRRR
jgi:hypothetical protein